jgi:hypothetical protein
MEPKKYFFETKEVYLKKTKKYVLGFLWMEKVYSIK